MADSTDSWPPVGSAELRAAGFILPEPKHRLFGSACSCGEWSAGCGDDIPEQWRQHVNATEGLVKPTGSTGGDSA